MVREAGVDSRIYGLKDAEGKPLFNGYQISQIILSGAEAKEKQELIEDLMNRKDTEGKPLFNGYQISQIIFSGATKKRSRR